MLWSGPLRLSHGITHANACTHSLSRFSDRAIRGTKGFTMTVKLGVNLWSQASDWPSFLAAGTRAEELGYDSLWTWDHIYAIFGDPYQPIVEGYTALAALAQATSRIRLGLFVGANTFRNPGLAVKSLTTIDHISRGTADVAPSGAWAALRAP